jgi:hypothetical protein
MLRGLERFRHGMVWEAKRRLGEASDGMALDGVKNYHDKQDVMRMATELDARRMVQIRNQRDSINHLLGMLGVSAPDASTAADQIMLLHDRIAGLEVKLAAVHDWAEGRLTSTSREAAESLLRLLDAQ